MERIETHCPATWCPPRHCDDGNHDIDTFDEHEGAEIHQGLLNLGPDYPCHPVTGENHYWDKRVNRISGDGWQVVSLNSCLMRHLKKTERDHGMIDDQTLGMIRSVIGEESFPVNVLLCHHHPQPFARLVPDDSHMDSGDRLVGLLDELPDRWMVVHGHKHEPHLDYLGGTGSQPTRLVAGSLGIILYAALSAHVRNQLHLIEFPVDRCRDLHLSMAGRVRSWTWAPTTEWREAKAGDGLPAIAGFGFHRAPDELATELVDYARARDMVVVEREHLDQWQPRLPFLLPVDLDRLQRGLEERHGCRVSIDLAGNLDRVVMG